MKEPYSEGLASHTGPESCVGVREDTDEALTGVHIGQVLSSEITQFGVPTVLAVREGNMIDGVIASHQLTLRSRRP